MNIHRQWFVLLLYIVLYPAASAQLRPSKLTDLPSAAQSNISATLGNRISGYDAIRLADHFRAENPQHDLSTDFTGDGVTIHSHAATWGMHVSAYGRGDILKAAAAATPEADANRIQYSRGDLTEWYLNGPLGLEQGFTLTQRLGKSNRGPLAIELTLSGNLKAAVADAKSLSLISNDGKRYLSYAGLSASDADNRELRAWLDLRGNRLRIHVDDRTARYPIVIDPWVQVAEVSASDGGNSDEFGWSVAAGNNVVVVGAPFHTVGSNVEQGAAYVFVEAGSGWANMTETAELTASDGVADAYFGNSVAIDGNTIVVGAPGTTIGGNLRQGSAYVFVEPAQGWTNMTETAELAASDGYVGDNLGNSVSISNNTIAAGAPYASVGSNYEQGAAYVFVQPANGWTNMTQTAKLTASDGASGDILGVAVNINGSTVAAGASEATVDGYPSAGAAYVFVEGNNGWSDMTQTAKLTATDAAIDDYFGSAIDMTNNTIVVGAPSDFSGAVYVFVQPPNGWANMTQTAELTPSVTTTELLLGSSVAISTNIVVGGAVAAGVGQNQNQGQVLVFVQPPSGWKNMNQTTQLFSQDGAAGDAFGHSIAIGGNAGIAGAPFHMNGSGAQGLGYVFQALNSRPHLTSLLPNNTDAGGPGFTLTVNGSNFVPDTTVEWNGSPRSTTFVSSTEVQATILASDIAQPGRFKVTAVNPPPGGGTSSALIFTVNNPVPSMQSIDPDSAIAGGPAFTLTVMGSNFVTNSKVEWNGAQLSTTYVSNTKLTALVSARDISAAGTIPVTVFNPAPGGGTSNAIQFTIDNPVPNLTELIPSSIKAGSQAFTLTIEGSGFASTAQAYWNGNARQTTYLGPQKLKVAILASDVQSPGTAQVTVGNPQPGGGLSNPLTFTIKQ
ncbi:MAG TPA: IPT/TIG domain-containing protein [Terriglobales bacterium]|nr:IPT/TIG domain-containing protein [Terriglobales bacterium]